jgi:hypothetical protein
MCELEVAIFWDVRPYSQVERERERVTNVGISMVAAVRM